MNQEKEILTPQESLDVITSMIRQAKGKMKKSSFYFLLWGWTIVIANLGVYVMLKFTSSTNPFLFFGVTIPAAIISVVYGAREERSASAPTLLDQINKWLWIGFGITCFILALFGNRIGWQINPVIITMCAVPTYVSGVMLRFKPLMFGGIAFWILGIISFLAPKELQFLLAAVAVILGYLVPGYLLKRSEA
jgi:hypothetical protein